ncbi:VOC family protein [Polynucleobacter necessarius]|uniref:VOC family protein n=1 Tax=Polynucleobacter necessarius TaxID=576610 RepID=UPI000E09AEB4
MTHTQEYPFDHLVIIDRDQLHKLGRKFLSQGFQLTPLAHHNLGSINQLIMLDSSYIELLEWESGKPLQRAEIANQPLGLDALVFRQTMLKRLIRIF